MAWKLQLPTSGYISIPIWSVAANQDFVIDIVFDTPPTLAVDGVLGNSTDSSFLAVFNSGSVETKLNGNYLTGISGSPANANIFVASNQYRWRVERVSNSCRVTITNLTTSTVKQDVSGYSFSGAFSFTWIGNTQGLILGGGRFYTVTLSRSGDNRIYDASASGGSGTILPDTASGQNGTQIGTWPADNSEWVFYSTGGTTYTLNADGGTFSYSGGAASLLMARILSANGGNFSYSGGTASLRLARRLQADGGAFNYSGADASLRYGRLLNAEGGAFAFSGGATGLLYGRTLQANGGSFGFSGGAASFDYTPVTGYVMVAEGASFSYSGSPAEFEYVQNFPIANVSNYTVSGMVDDSFSFGSRISPAVSFGAIISTTFTFNGSLN